MDEFIAQEFATMMYIEDVVGVLGFSLGEVNRREMLKMSRKKMLDILIGGTLGSKKGPYLGIKNIKACE